MIKKLLTIALLLIPIFNCFSADSIAVDGLFDDWSSVSIAHTDMAEDGLDEDFAELKITNDNNFLFLKLSFHNQKQLLQDFNSIRLFIDTDNNDQSGYQIQGIGSELEWCFGCRQGAKYNASGQSTIFQSDIVFRSAPTITSYDFEIAIGLNSDAWTSGGSKTPDSIKIVLLSSDYSDEIPDKLGGIQYIIDTSFVDEPNPIPLAKDHYDDIRIISYNTLAGGLVDAGRQQYFERIIRALNPDIFAFQEQGDQNIVKDLIGFWLEHDDFHIVQLGNNNIVVSKFAILNQSLITQSARTMAVLLNTEIELGTNLLIMNSHLACCSNNDSRQKDADEITSVLRKWHNGEGPFPIQEYTPIVHLGDFNLVGDAQQLNSLTDGDIVDEDTYGDDFLPDWDNTPLKDLFSMHTSTRMGYTWRNDNSSFSPGKLDYILYTNSVIEIGNHYVLNTLAMSQKELDASGLFSDDTNLASDHLPRVLDILPIVSLAIPEEIYTPKRFQLFPASPNPFNPTSKIQYSLPVTTFVSLKVFDMLGHEVKTLVNELKPAGHYVVEFDATGLASGIYFYRLDVEGFSDVKKIILLK